MKRIYLNLKRFDIPTEMGGVNSFAKPRKWGKRIIQGIREGIEKYSPEELELGIYLPELHLYTALKEAGDNFRAKLGPQSVYKSDVAKGGNFGAFTSNRTAKSVVAMGATTTMIGHCEERNDKQETMKEVLGILGTDIEDADTRKALQHATNQLLNQEVLAAQAAGLDVLYCLGEKSEEQENFEEVVADQIETGLAGVDLSKVTIAYEPVWAIGPGKTPPGADCINKIAIFIKSKVDVPVVYGGGLKKENAAMLAGIDTIDGGLIALTSFTDPIGFYPDQYLEIIDEYMNNI